MGVDTQQLQGFDDVAAKLRAIAPALRRRALRNALAAGGRLVRDDARRRAPVLVNAAQAPNRTPGLVRSQIVVRTSKLARQAGDVGVFVNVRPAKGARYKVTTGRVLGVRLRAAQLVRASDRGANSRRDPFYWRFLEFGTKHMAARPFLRPAVERLPQALTVFRQQIGAWVARTNATGQVTP